MQQQIEDLVKEFSTEDNNSNVIPCLNILGINKYINENLIEKPFPRVNIKIEGMEYNLEHYLSSRSKDYSPCNLHKEITVNQSFFDYISFLYQNNLELIKRRKRGVFYTQQDVVEYMINKCISILGDKESIRILDPSCGTGNFLVSIVRFLKKQAFTKKLIIHGIDLDKYAIEIALSRIILENDGKLDLEINLVIDDALFTPISQDFDLIIGNPPYIGHKDLSLSYKEQLRLGYPDTYIDKADISYCFFDKYINCLSPRGILSFITSRYFIEALNGQGLRRKLEKHDILEIIDFYGLRILQDIQVDPLIITLSKNKTHNPAKVKRITTLQDMPLSKLLDDNSPNIECFLLDRHNFNNGTWYINSTQQKTILDKMMKSQCYRLSDVVNSFQGIITGCDKAFVMDYNQIQDLKVDPDLIEPWLKNRHVHKFEIEDTNQCLIYSDDIENIESQSSIYKHIEKYRERLENRRECKSGLKKWYHLQWGRNKKNFKQPKIIYRYKSDSNTFALDLENRFFSADIYALSLKPQFQHLLDYQYLLVLLNSCIAEFYFKSICKKLGVNLYEYYPNKILTIPIPLEYDKTLMKEMYKDITIRGGYSLKDNEYLARMYDLSSEDIEYITKWLNK